MSKFITESVYNSKRIPIASGDEAQKITQVTTPESIGKWKTGKELFDLNIKEVPKLWEPFILKTGLVGITGPSESGKSLLTRGLAMAIVLGRTSYLGYQLNAKYNRAYIVSTEDGLSSTAANLRKSYSDGAMTIALTNLVFLFETDSLITLLDEKLSYKPADLIIVDTWSDTFSGNLNSAIEVRRDLDPLSQLAEKHGCAIILVHHNGKNSERSAPDKNKLNGSQAIEAKLRLLLDLRQGDKDNERVLSVAKCNYLSDKVKGVSIILAYDPERHILSNTGQQVSKASVAEKSKVKRYDEQLWVPRMNSLRKKSRLSFEEAREQLVKACPQLEVPGLTWFKTECKKWEEGNKSNRENKPMDENISALNSEPSKNNSDGIR